MKQRIRIEFLNPTLRDRFVYFIPYPIWKFINLLEWVIWSPLMSRLKDNYSWCPIEPDTGYNVWKCIHE